MKRTALSVLALCFAALVAYSGWRAWNEYGDYRAESQMHSVVIGYKPTQLGTAANQSVIDLQTKYPAVAGWLTVPGTGIDYPFVWYKDNDYYLRRDLNGNRAMAGTLFMDFRCQRDFTSQNTILYGHHMKNGSMFGTLKRFSDKEFFDAHQRAAVYLPRATLILECFAYLVVTADDAEIYATAPSKDYLDYVRQNARQYSDIGLKASDRIVTLSTCSYEFNNARMVLLTRIQQTRG